MASIRVKKIEQRPKLRFCVEFTELEARALCAALGSQELHAESRRIAAEGLPILGRITEREGTFNKLFTQFCDALEASGIPPHQDIVNDPRG